MSALCHEQTHTLQQLRPLLLYAICCDGRHDTAHVRKRGVVLWDWLPTSWSR